MHYGSNREHHIFTPPPETRSWFLGPVLQGKMSSKLKYNCKCRSAYRSWDRQTDRLKDATDYIIWTNDHLFALQPKSWIATINTMQHINQMALKCHIKCGQRSQHKMVVDKALLRPKYFEIFLSHDTLQQWDKFQWEALYLCGHEAQHLNFTNNFIIVVIQYIRHGRIQACTWRRLVEWHHLLSL